MVCAFVQFTLGDGWMLLDVGLQRVVRSGDMLFHEDTFPGLGVVCQKTI